MSAPRRELNIAAGHFFMTALQFDFLDNLFKASYNNSMEKVEYVFLSNKKFAVTHCLHCGKEKLKEPSQLKKYPNSFCNSSCAASYNNHLPKRKKEGTQHACLNCGVENDSTYVTEGDLKKIIKGERPKRNGKFCSNLCQHQYEWEKKKERIIEEGIQCLNLTSHQGQDRILKQIIIELNPHGKTGKACWKCGWEEVNIHIGKSNTSKKYKREGWRLNQIPTQLNHIDGDPTNQSLDNLEIVCPNCHSLHEYYGSRGKGGRKK